MLFSQLQSTVQGLIAAGPLFVGGTVLSDDGHVRPKIENALDISNTPPGIGWAVSVWPPTKGSVIGDDASGAAPIEWVVVVRTVFNPQFLTAQDAMAAADGTGNTPNGAAFVANILQSEIQLILAAAPDSGGTKFQLAPDCFELIDFDEGILAFHTRFKRLIVF